jgi:hypothetical protein
MHRELRRLIPLALIPCLAAPARAQLFHASAIGADDGEFGHAVVSVGDLDGDGCDELAIGEPMWDSSTSVDCGRVTILDGATGTLLRTHDGSRNTTHFGAAIAGVGDWTGDGVGDYVIGGPGLDQPTTDVGSLQLYSGQTGNFIRLVSGATNELLGSAIARVADYDGDGVDELLAGVPAIGVARLYDAHFNVLLTLTGSASDEYGFAVAGLGDLDGDGVADFAVGDPGYDSLFPFKVDRGRVVLCSGATGALITSIIGLQAGDYFGRAIARLGDLDGDGVADLVVGTSEADNVGLDNGQVRLFSGATRATLFTLDGAAAGDELGYALAGLADLDHDGIDDFAISAPFGGGSDLGLVEVRSGADAHVLWTEEGSSGFFVADEQLGRSIAAGDWNGDGVGDLAVGNPLYSYFDFVAFAWHEPGRVSLHLGCPAWRQNYGSGLAGKNGVPTIGSFGDPGFGTTLIVSVGNSYGASTSALLLAGTSPANLPYKGGTILVNADLTSLFFTMGSFGSFFIEDVPDDPALAFVDLYVQVLEADPFAVKGISMTPGLQLRLGYDLP